MHTRGNRLDVWVCTRTCLGQAGWRMLYYVRACMHLVWFYSGSLAVSLLDFHHNDKKITKMQTIRYVVSFHIGFVLWLVICLDIWHVITSIRKCIFRLIWCHFENVKNCRKYSNSLKNNCRYLHLSSLIPGRVVWVVPEMSLFVLFSFSPSRACCTEKINSENQCTRRNYN